MSSNETPTAGPTNLNDPSNSNPPSITNITSNSSSGNTSGNVPHHLSGSLNDNLQTLESGEHEGNHGEKTAKFINENDTVEDKKDLDGSPDSGHENKKGGRRKINIEFIEQKSRRHVTFSKRKAGLIKKAYELSTLTGTQVLLLVASETGNVYTFATPKLQPLITKPEGKTLIQSCLNPPDQTQHTQPPPPPTSNQRMISQEPGMYPEKKDRIIKEPMKGGGPPIGEMPSFPNSNYPPPSSSNPNLMSNPSVMYSYSMSSMSPFAHPSTRGVGPNPYSQFQNASHSYSTSGTQFPSSQMQGQQPPSHSYSGYHHLGFPSGQSNPSFSGHEGGSSPRHND